MKDRIWVYKLLTQNSSKNYNYKINYAELGTVQRSFFFQQHYSIEK